MRIGFLGIWLLASVSAGSVCAEQQPGTHDEVAKIEGLYATWRDAVEKGDRQAYVSLLHPQVRMLPPGAPAIDTADSYSEFLRPVFAMATYTIEVDQAPEVEVMGDVAVAQYDYTISLNLKNPSVGVSVPGALTASQTSARYFDVLRKTDTGQWLVWRHGWQVW